MTIGKIKYLMIFGILIDFLILLIIIQFPKNYLQIIACDVGQGDAILIQEGVNQILVDGGPDGKVLDCLSRYMPFWDRRINLVVNTHPERDHYEGLINVFERYQVENYLTTGLIAGTPDYRVLQNSVGGASTKVIFSGDTSSIGIGLMHLEILKGSENDIFSKTQKVEDTPLGNLTTDESKNEFSIVTLLSYKNFESLLTGDIPANNLEDLISKNMNKFSSLEYIKIPHHGSRGGINKDILDALNPQFAVISLGRNNSYGHPAPEVIKLLTDKNIKTLRTDQSGNVEVDSDGSGFWLK
jgi:competence protein ComEC